MDESLPENSRDAGAPESQLGHVVPISQVKGAVAGWGNVRIRKGCH